MYFGLICSFYTLLYFTIWRDWIKFAFWNHFRATVGSNWFKFGTAVARRLEQALALTTLAVVIEFLSEEPCIKEGRRAREEGGGDGVEGGGGRGEEDAAGEGSVRKRKAKGVQIWARVYWTLSEPTLTWGFSFSFFALQIANRMESTSTSSCQDEHKN